MRNRNLAFVTAAICLAAFAAHFHAPKKIVSAALPTSDSENASIPITTVRTAIASTNPADQALAQLRDLFAQDPSDQAGRAAELLNQECSNKNFQTALKLMDAVPRDLREDWLKIIFNRWAQVQPEAAMSALEKIGNPDEWAGAFHAAIDGWNSADPAGLANYAIKLPESDERNDALSAALENWSMQDPTALATWLNTLPRGMEFDFGAALMLSKTDGANRSPELAMKWVENIGDPALKQTSFERVIAEWLQADSAAAKQYVATAAWLDDSTRTKVLGASQLPRSD